MEEEHRRSPWVRVKDSFSRNKGKQEAGETITVFRPTLHTDKGTVFVFGKHWPCHDLLELWVKVGGRGLWI